MKESELGAKDRLSVDQGRRAWDRCIWLVTGFRRGGSDSKGAMSLSVPLSEDETISAGFHFSHVDEEDGGSW